MNTQLKKLSQLIRYHILTSTTAAGSGHPTSSLSAVELMIVLMFGGFFRFDVDNPKNPNNDRLIFSKGHASPLFYALWSVTGAFPPEELLTLRKFNSRLEGHPTMAFPYTEAATGSLGQGLSIGVGMALNAKYLYQPPYRTFVLLGDSEMAEGSCWEAIQLAAYYKLGHLIGILDVNRLGQRGETMYGHDVSAYQKRIAAFGWETITVDGHSLIKIIKAYRQAILTKNQPVMIIAKTIKGKGVSFLEDKDGWHGKPLKNEQLAKALEELGRVDLKIKGRIEKPKKGKFSINNFQFTNKSKSINHKSQHLQYEKDETVATRKAYGNALVRIFPQFINLVVLDAETSNSTYAEIFKKTYPDRFFEMFIAEQNMVGVALGLSSRGKIPFVSTFAAFLSRAFDQIRMSQYSMTNIKFVGSHAGVSIGVDGSSQMGLEDLAMFSSILGSVILYPSDAVSTEKLVEASAKHQGIVYIRTTREETPIIYKPTEVFPIGGSKTLRKSTNDRVTVIAAGITVHEALHAYEELKKDGIAIQVVDCYSIKPIDNNMLKKTCQETKAIITVEDHYPYGGLGSMVAQTIADFTHRKPVHILAVTKPPKSGKSQELLDYEGISAKGIVKKIKTIL